MSQDWDIKPRHKECCDCRREFADRQVYYARLVYGTEGYQRADFCAGCWPQQSQGQTHYSMWQGMFRVPPPEPERKIKKETAESLLRELMEHPDEAKAAVIYILAVMLERQRLLLERETETRSDGVRLVIYEHRKTGESFVIRDPKLQLNELERVQNDVLQLLKRPAPAAPAL
jgi:hypothetical protein